jgi:hypothetical protein
MKFFDRSEEEAEISVATREVLLPKRGRSKDFGRSKRGSATEVRKKQRFRSQQERFCYRKEEEAKISVAARDSAPEKRKNQQQDSFCAPKRGEKSVTVTYQCQICPCFSIKVAIFRLISLFNLFLFYYQPAMFMLYYEKRCPE